VEYLVSDFLLDPLNQPVFAGFFSSGASILANLSSIAADL